MILLLGCAGASGRGPGPGATGALEPMVGETAAPGDARVVTGAAGGLSEEAGYFMAEQAERGMTTFVSVCSECHYRSDFRGSDFEWNWRRQTVRNLYAEITRTMPEDAPGSLSDEEYIDVIAYFLQLNEYPSGNVALVPVSEVMDLVPLGPNARLDLQEQQ